MNSQNTDSPFSVELYLSSQEHRRLSPPFPLLPFSFFTHCRSEEIPLLRIPAGLMMLITCDRILTFGERIEEPREGARPTVAVSAAAQIVVCPVSRRVVEGICGWRRKRESRGEVHWCHGDDSGMWIEWCWCWCWHVGPVADWVVG